MDSDGLSGCLIILAVVLLKGFFTACDAAITEINDSKVKNFENEKGKKKVLFNILQKPTRLITAFSVNRIFTAVIIAYLSVIYYFVPLSNSIIDLFFPQTIGDDIIRSFGNPDYFLCEIGALVIILLVTVLVVTVFCDGLPKRMINSNNCDKFAVFCAPAVKILIMFFYPITTVSSLCINLLSKLLGLSLDSDRDVVTEEEILMMVDAGNETGVIEQSQREMINNIFEFDGLSASDVMTHRTDIIGVEFNMPVSEVVNSSISSGFSRIPVYEGTIDHIIGIICVKDLLCLVGSDSAGEADLKSFIRDIFYIPETLPCSEVFKRLTAQKMQMAVVIDEYGGTAGIVSMEDVVEAIVGNIQDEYDDDEDEIIKISDDTYTISGTADPEYILEQFGISLPEDNDFDTMSGFIVDLLGRIPNVNENPVVVYENVRFTVLITEDMCITKIKAKIINEVEEVDNEKNQLTNITKEIEVNEEKN